ALIITLELLPSLVWIGLGICSGFAFHQFGYRQELLQVTGMVGIGVSALGLAYQLRRDILPLVRNGVSLLDKPSESNSAQN
ncbi:MAG: hypothetical protein KDB07_07820, partial [Planctomycetes bacterium]|nr:hypothetical protein [Planctomycetota bacterium]